MLTTPHRLREVLSTFSFDEMYERRRPLPEGKAFWMGIVRRESGEIRAAASI